MSPACAIFSLLRSVAGLILDFLFNAVAAVTVQPWNPELVEQPATAEEILHSGRSGNRSFEEEIRP